jgi:hypothetical protein
MRENVCICVYFYLFERLPLDKSIPETGFSLNHINSTHKNRIKKGHFFTTRNKNSFFLHSPAFVQNKFVVVLVFELISFISEISFFSLKIFELFIDDVSVNFEFSLLDAQLYKFKISTNE